MFHQMSLLDLPSATSSPESVDGHMRSDSQAGPTISPYGPEAARVNLTPRQALAEGITTRAPFGGPSGGTSSSACLQSYLESRLQAKLDVNGSPEYALTWKQWGMEQGLPICALRASGRRISGSGCSGWPTAKSSDGTKGNRSHDGAFRELSRKGSSADLPTIAFAAGWPSPTVGNARGSQMAKGASTTGRRPDGSKATVSLNMVARAAGYPTPRANDSQKRGQIADDLRNGLPGLAQNGLIVQTEKGGALNPDLARWLMGFPVEWLLACPTNKPAPRHRIRTIDRPL